MPRPVVAVLAVFLVAATPVLASATDFSHTNCDSPQFKAFILSRLGHGKMDATGQLSPNRFSYGPIDSAVTIANSGNRISCRITVQLDTPKGSRSIRGVMTFTQAPGGQTGWHWAPGA